VHLSVSTASSDGTSGEWYIPSSTCRTSGMVQRRRAAASSRCSGMLRHRPLATMLKTADASPATGSYETCRPGCRHAVDDKPGYGSGCRAKEPGRPPVLPDQSPHQVVRCVSPARRKRCGNRER
jgi:hypothetical protein